MLLLALMMAVLPASAGAKQEVSIRLDRIFATQNAKIDIDGVDDKRVDIDIAVFDSGIDLEHGDLNVVEGVNCLEAIAPSYTCSTGKPGDGDDAQLPYHGTLVSASIAAIDNGLGSDAGAQYGDPQSDVGAAPGARLWAIDVHRAVLYDELNAAVSLYKEGKSWTNPELDMESIIAGVKWVTAHADQIEVVHFGVLCYTDPPVSKPFFVCDPEKAEELYEAIDESIEAGVVYVGAVGVPTTGAGIDPDSFIPAGNPNVLLMSPIVDTDGKPGGKGPAFGEISDDTGNVGTIGENVVDIVAPDPGGAGSGAGPLVVGAAAILASQDNPESAADVKDIRDALVGAGNSGWTDEYTDGIKEPLLDVHDEGLFNPKTLPGCNQPGVPEADSDVNGDGRADLVSLRTNGVLYVHPGGSESKFGSGVASFGGDANLDPAQYDGVGDNVVDVADVNGDGCADLVTLNSDDGYAHVYPGRSDLTFGFATKSLEAMTPALLRPGGYEPIAVADVNGGGNADLIAFNDQTDKLMVYPGRSDTRFDTGVEAQSGLTSALHTVGGHYFIDAADVTGDGRADLVSMRGGDLNVFAGQSSGAFAAPEASQKGAVDPAMDDGVGYEPVGLGDVTGDGKTDLALVKSGTVYLYPAQSGAELGKFGTPKANFGGVFTSSTFNPANLTEMFGLYDVTGDGLADLVGTNNKAVSVAVVPGKAEGTFGSAVGTAGPFPSTQHFQNQNSTGNEFVLEKPSWRRKGCLPTGCVFDTEPLFTFYTAAYEPPACPGVLMQNNVVSGGCVAEDMDGHFNLGAFIPYWYNLGKYNADFDLVVDQNGDGYAVNPNVYPLEASLARVACDTAEGKVIPWKVNTLSPEEMYEEIEMEITVGIRTSGSGPGGMCTQQVITVQGTSLGYETTELTQGSPSANIQSGYWLSENPLWFTWDG